MKITCPECSERFDVSPDMIGKKAKCGECAHVFVVPEVADKKTKPEKGSAGDAKEVRQAAWLSLYLAALAVLLLLFRGHQGGLIATMLFALAIEAAAVCFVWRALMVVWPYKSQSADSPLISTAILVNGVLLALIGLSVLLTIYAMVSGGGGAGGLGSLGDLMKTMNNAIPK